MYLCKGETMIFSIPELPVQYLQVIEAIKKLREQLRYATSDSIHRWTGLLARMAAARAMVGTNTIEGLNVTMDDAVAIIDGEPVLAGDLKTRAELFGYWNAMTYIVQLARDQNYVHNEGTIKSLHFMMLSHELSMHPGRWRPGGIHVSNTATNQIVYEGPDIAMVPALISELLAFLNNNKDEPLVKAAMAHINFTMIHPFSDGNGRMARALQTMVLSREGILDPRFSSIEEYIGAQPAKYYAVLADVGQGAWNPHRDALPWIKFCLTAHYWQAVQLLRRNEQLTNLWNQLEDLAKKMRLNPRVIPALADAAVGFKVKNPTYRKQAAVTNQVAKYDLKNLADMKLLVPVGEKRGRYYECGDLLKEIRKRTLLPKTNIDPFAVPAHPVQSTLPGFPSASASGR
jgi:Fic family protein